MNTTAPTDYQVARLVEAIERAAQAGREAEADSLLEQARQFAPGHPLVLNQAAVRELRRGRPTDARALLEQALARDATRPGAWLNLASAYRAIGRPEDEMQALERALALEPANLLALLQKGALLELLGRQREAADAYRTALGTLQPSSRLPQFLEPALRHAQEVVRAAVAELDACLDRELADVRQRHAAARQDRFDHCLDALLGKRRIYESQPAFLRFPKVPALEFHDRDRFAWLDALEAAAGEIRAELAAVLQADAGRVLPYVDFAGADAASPWAELNHSQRWSAYFLWQRGESHAEALARCPRTAAALAAANVPRADVPGQGPGAWFSVLAPHTRVPAHTGLTNTRLLVHLPLEVPPGAGLRVGADRREPVVGRAYVFDETLEHEFWNDGDQPFSWLAFDVWNPYLTAAERDLVRAATEAIHRYHRGQPSAAGRPFLPGSPDA